MTSISTDSPGWLDVATLCDQAWQKTFEGLQFSALQILCASLNSMGPRLHFLGKQRIRRRLEEVLTWRVGLEEWIRDHPEAASEPLLPPPVVIVSPFRTGTTLLQRLLAQDTRFRWIRFWEALYAPSTIPSSKVDDDGRRERFRIDLNHLYRLNPALASLHPMGVDLPDECFGFLETSLLSPSFLLKAPVSEYVTWLQGIDESAWDQAYARYANHLRMLAWMSPGGRWLLKSPVHLWNLGALRRSFPDALFIHLHRDPAASVRSFCSLIAAHHSIALRKVDLMETGRLVSQFYAFALSRAVAVRKASTPGLDVDIGFDDLVDNPLIAIRPIYAAAGLDLDLATESQMRDWLRIQEKPPSNAAETNLMDFGLQDSVIRELFAGYQSFLTRVS